MLGKTVEKRKIKGTKIRRSETRGVDDPGAILDAIAESWEDIQAVTNALGDSEKDALKSHFNGLIEEHDTLGDILFCDADDFTETVTPLSIKEKRTYTDELVNYGVVNL